MTEPKIVATSQTRWRDIPESWRDAATRAVVDAGYGDTPMAVVAVITSALWELTQQPEPIPDEVMLALEADEVDSVAALMRICSFTAEFAVDVVRIIRATRPEVNDG